MALVCKKPSQIPVRDQTKKGNSIIPLAHLNHMFGFRSPKHQQIAMSAALKQIEKMLKTMEEEGKDLRTIKLKRFQKTHHIDCRCPQCKEAKRKNDPRIRGLREDGFKVFFNSNDREER